MKFRFYLVAALVAFCVALISCNPDKEPVQLKGASLAEVVDNLHAVTFAEAADVAAKYDLDTVVLYKQKDGVFAQFLPKAAAEVYRTLWRVHEKGNPDGLTIEEVEALSKQYESLKTVIVTWQESLDADELYKELEGDLYLNTQAEVDKQFRTAENYLASHTAYVNYWEASYMCAADSVKGDPSDGKAALYLAGLALEEDGEDPHGTREEFLARAKSEGVYWLEEVGMDLEVKYDDFTTLYEFDITSEKDEVDGPGKYAVTYYRISQDPSQWNIPEPQDAPASRQTPAPQASPALRKTAAKHVFPWTK